MEEGESLFDTIKREVMEELGLEVQSCEYVGTIIDSYNLIKRITVSSFFHCLVDSSALQETHHVAGDKGIGLSGHFELVSGGKDIQAEGLKLLL